jgi:hypothetical protein
MAKPAGSLKVVRFAGLVRNIKSPSSQVFAEAQVS